MKCVMERVILHCWRRRLSFIGLHWSCGMWSMLGKGELATAHHTSCHWHKALRCFCPLFLRNITWSGHFLCCFVGAMSGHGGKMPGHLFPMGNLSRCCRDNPFVCWSVCGLLAMLAFLFDCLKIRCKSGCVGEMPSAAILVPILWVHLCRPW